MKTALLAILLLITPAAAAPPKGLVQFCAANASQCLPSGAGVPPLAVLQGINRAVNHDMHYQRERQGLDAWRVNTRTGDCEDYVLTKRARLIVLGYDASALRIAIVLTPDVQFHAVLLVGDLVLDNLNLAVTAFGDTGYIRVGVYSADPLTW